MALKKVALLFVAASLSACASTAPKVNLEPIAMKEGALTEVLADKTTQRLNDPYVRGGLLALERGQYAPASAHFNQALKFDPANAQLHFLNGLTYHLMAAAGDASKYDMAKVGYNLAIQYDSGHYWAAYLRGHISLTERHWDEAQEAFAYALMFKPKNVTILKALASASYYAQDIETALSSIEKAIELAPNDAAALYEAVMVRAAAGDNAGALDALERYEAAAGDKGEFRAEYLTGRMRDWQNFHQRQPLFQKASGFSTSDIFGSSDTKQGLSYKAKKSKKGGKDAKKEPLPTKMALVDVIIIRSEERNATGKGVNLLSGLSTTLSGTLFSLSDSGTSAYANNPTTITKTRTKTWTMAPSFGISASYSLNIFNDNYDKNEVLARPTLVGLDGKQSEFFSGAVWHVEVQGAAGSEGSIMEVPVGIKLAVTPQFINEDTVELNVQAARAFVEGRSANAGFNNFAQVSKTMVSANVTMKFGDTLVLSGLSEKETEKLRDGVPILQDIPGVQYLFSRQDTLDYTKSVLVLLTPRKPRYTWEDGTEKIVQGERPPEKEKPNLMELKGRPDWFRPASNLDSVFFHLKDGEYFKEFRTGDVSVERWNTPGRLERMIERSVEFLYF